MVIIRVQWLAQLLYKWGVNIWHLAWNPTLISWLLAVPLGRFEDHELEYAMAISFLILNHPLNWTYLIFTVCRTLLEKMGKFHSAPACTQFPHAFFAPGQSEFHLSIFTLHKLKFVIVITLVSINFTVFCHESYYYCIEHAFWFYHAYSRLLWLSHFSIWNSLASTSLISDSITLLLMRLTILDLGWPPVV